MTISVRCRRIAAAGLAAGAWALAPAAPALAQAAGSPAPEQPLEGVDWNAVPDPGAEYSARELAEDVLLVQGPGGNIVAGVAPDGLIVFGGTSEAHAADLVDFLAAETGVDTIATAVATHWHPHASGANAAFKEAGATVLAHANTDQWMRYGTRSRSDGRDYPARDEAALPDETFLEEGAMIPFGDDEIRVGYMLQAHTDSDLYAYFPAANVLATGPGVRSDAWQDVDWWTGGYIGGIWDAYETLLEIADEDTVIVPESGPVMTRAELQEQFEMYREIYNRMGTNLKASLGPAEQIDAEPTAGFRPEWGDAERFVELAHRSFYGHLRGDRRLGAIP